ncbi:hypothetical protein E2C01_034357 [Portunus trituberculatus]|uniref:Uncharacterized protein n=1 Tax=Portunus trituberculatus TaxID=210409 RepID=A0A5B7F6S2_PORTR|nr:hypothetical protein [Portunus trituberculatus]
MARCQSAGLHSVRWSSRSGRAAWCHLSRNTLFKAEENGDFLNVSATKLSLIFQIPSTALYTNNERSTQCYITSNANHQHRLAPPPCYSGQDSVAGIDQPFLPPRHTIPLHNSLSSAEVA